MKFIITKTNQQYKLFKIMNTKYYENDGLSPYYYDDAKEVARNLLSVKHLLTNMKREEFIELTKKIKGYEEFRSEDGILMFDDAVTEYRQWIDIDLNISEPAFKELVNIVKKEGNIDSYDLEHFCKIFKKHDKNIFGIEKYFKIEDNKHQPVSVFKLYKDEIKQECIVNIGLMIISNTLEDESYRSSETEILSDICEAMENPAGVIGYLEPFFNDEITYHYSPYNHALFDFLKDLHEEITKN